METSRPVAVGRLGLGAGPGGTRYALYPIGYPFTHIPLPDTRGCGSIKLKGIFFR